MVCIILGGMVIKFIGTLIKWSGASGFDRFLGVLFGLTRGLIVLFVIFLLLPSSVKSTDLINKSKIVFPNVKHNFGYGYGLTESGAITIINWGDTLDSNPTSPGQPMPTIHVELRDDNGELILDDDVEGEIYVKSPSVMLGYYKNLTATAESLTEDRTLKTGDFAYRNKGLFFISSRRTDLILRGLKCLPQESNSCWMHIQRLLNQQLLESLMRYLGTTS